MCTVIIEVPDAPTGPVRMLAVRDEHPERAWDPPGYWWPNEHPGIIGVRDRKAGGAWLAADQDAVSVILNRAESVAELLQDGEPPLDSRGRIVLDSVEREPLEGRPHTESFNLVEIRDGVATVTHWDGVALAHNVLEPGVHMIAHGAINDVSSARIGQWLPEYRSLAGLPTSQWRAEWIKTLELSAELGPDDDRAIIRDNTSHGYPTKSLLVCLVESEISGASITAASKGGVTLDSAVLTEAARWSGEKFIRHTLQE